MCLNSIFLGFTLLFIFNINSVIALKMDRTHFIEGQPFLCQTAFETTLELMSFDYNENELFVGTKDVLYEVEGSDLNNSLFAELKSLVDIDATKGSFDLKVLHYYHPSTKFSRNTYVVFCGLADDGSCFRITSNLMHSSLKSSKIGMQLSPNVYSSLHADSLIIANNKASSDHSFMSVFDISTNFSSGINVPFKASTEYEVVGSFALAPYWYMVVNRKKQMGMEAYLLRTCSQPDSSKKAFVELKLTCENGNDKFLYALSVTLSEKMQFVDGKRTRQKDRSNIFLTFKLNQKANKAAFCYYKLSTINKEFDSVVNACLQHTGGTHPSNINTDYPGNAMDSCSQDTHVNAVNFCQEASFAITSLVTIKNDPKDFFSLQENVPASFLVTSVKKSYVAFVAYANYMIKLKIPNDETSPIETSQIKNYTHLQFDKFETIKSMAFDNYNDVFVLRDNSVCKVQRAMCQLRSCEECIEDPHCGWCVNANKKKCVLKEECGMKYWMDNSCPVVQSISPNTTTLDNFENQKFLLDTKFMLKDFDIAECQLRVDNVTDPITKPAETNGQQFTCNEFDKIVIYSKDIYYKDVEISIMLDNIEWGKKVVSLYDCKRFDSCTSCLSDADKFPCVWCMTTHSCQNKQDYCITSSIAEETELVQDADKCPRIMPHPEEKKLYASGSVVEYKIKGAHLMNSLSPFYCKFEVDGEGEKIVKGHVSQLDTVTCEGVELDYKASKPNTTVSVSLLTLDKNDIDNPAHLKLTLYKCYEMQTNCGRCSQVDEKYDCVWCKEGHSGMKNFCSVSRNCQQKLVSNEFCPNPMIMKFDPPGGPVKGNTHLTITGENLGREMQDVKVYVGIKPCQVVSYTATHEIVCKTGSQSSRGLQTVWVTVGRMYNATATEQYDYNEHTVSMVHPSVGIKQGGTTVTISGQHLDYGSHKTVLFHLSEAAIVSFTDKQIVVKSPSSSAKKKVKVIVKIDNGKEKASTSQFEYKDDPLIDDHYPNESLLSGGSKITLSGSGLEHVSTAYLVVMVEKDRAYTSPPCTLEGRKFVCTTPVIPVKKDDEDDKLKYKKYKLKFQLDNFSYPSVEGKDSTLIKFYYDPEFEQIKENTKVNDLKQPFGISYKPGSQCVPEMDNEMKMFAGGKACGEVRCSENNDQVLFTPDTCERKKGGTMDVEIRMNNFHANLGKLTFQKASAKRGLIVGLIMGLLLALLIALFIFLCCLYRRKRKNGKWGGSSTPANRPPGLETVNNQTGNNAVRENPYKSRPGSSDEQTSLNQDYLNPNAFLNDEQYLNALLERLDNQNIRNAAKEIYIARERLEFGNQLGKGHFGKVHAATLKDANLKNPCLVAVKTIDDPDMDQKMVEGFLKEGVIMKNFNHPHVLNLIGLCLGYKKEPMVVLPFMANGDLRSYVKDKKRSFTARQLLKLAQQVAEGMSYLASLNFIHRDLAARNCMIDDKSQVKVADFGLSHQLHDSEYYSSKNRKAKLPIKWMALESLENYVFTTKSDVWAFGVLLWELMTRGVTPYPDVDVFETRNYLTSGRRLYKPKFCPDNVYAIMMDCWQELPERRPTFTDLVNRIEVLLNPPRHKDTAADKAGATEPTYMNMKDKEYMQDYLKPNVVLPDGTGKDAESSSEEEGGGVGDKNVSQVLLSADKKKEKRAIEVGV